MKLKTVSFLLLFALISCEKDEETQASFNYVEVSDIDGNTYHTVQIGEQTWTVDNLKTKHLNNGSQTMNIKKWLLHSMYKRIINQKYKPKFQNSCHTIFHYSFL